MTKIIVALFGLFCLVGCDMLIDSYNYEQLGTHNIYYGEFGQITTKGGVAAFLQNNITYASGDESIVGNDFEITLERGFGNCKDFSIGYLNLMYVCFGKKGSIVAVDYNLINKNIVAGGLVDHAMVLIDGYIIEPQSGKVTGTYEDNIDKIGYIYYFDEIFN